MADLNVIKAVNPFDIQDTEGLNLTQQDVATLTNIGNEVFTLGHDAQGAALGVAASTDGGKALFRGKVIQGLVMGAVLGGVLTWGTMKLLGKR